MASRFSVVFLAAAVLLLPWAADAQCTAGTQVLNTCAGYTFTGCCTVDNHVRWCEGGVTCDIDCNPPNTPACGWDALNMFYDCGQPAQGDPSCINPYACIKGGCLPSSQKGCCNCPCQACVCAKMPTCCSGQWAAQCATLCKVDCAGCGSPNGCGTAATPGCAGCSCELCVCNQDAFCCTVAWDAACVTACKTKCGGQCGCVPSCAGKQCGTDGCGGTCGSCPAGYQCDALGHCGCVPSCAGKQCGEDGCGGSCGTCPPKYTCAGGLCKCIQDCVAKQCGDDGCGGSCGTCPANMKCESFNCVPGECAPDCAGKQCGDDTCGGSCGSCPGGFFCNDAGTCQPIGCDPSCDGKQCGDDGCGGSCGTCAEGDECKEGQCVPICIPDCTDKQCGDDLCGGSCGTCAEGDECEEGQCLPTCKPLCLNKECGPDGCGSECGVCGPDFECNEFGVCVEASTADPDPDAVSPPDAVTFDSNQDAVVPPQPDVSGDSVSPDATQAPEAEAGPDVAMSDAHIETTSDGVPNRGCPPGMVLYYGKCSVPKDLEEKDKGSKSGCGVARGDSSGRPLHVFPVMAALFFLIYRSCALRRERARERRSQGWGGATTGFGRSL